MRMDLPALQDRLARLERQALLAPSECPVCRENMESRVLSGLLGCLAYLEAMGSPEPMVTTGYLALRAVPGRRG